MFSAQIRRENGLVRMKCAKVADFGLSIGTGKRVSVRNAKGEKNALRN